MSVKVILQPETERRLAARAAARGEDVDTYTSRLIEEAVSSPTLDEVLAPYRQQVARSGMSDDEIDAFHRDLLDKVRKDRKADQK